MSEIRTTPTVNELRAVIFDHPSSAFGFCVKTSRPVEDIAAETAGIAVRDKSFPLQGGAYGLNVIGTAQAFAHLLYNIETTGMPAQAHYLLRDGADQVPVYDMSRGGGTSKPLPVSSLNIPR